MEARLVFAPVTHLPVEAVCTQLRCKPDGAPWDNWQNQSANRDIIHAVGMNFHQQIFGIRYSVRDRPVFVVSDTAVVRTPVRRVIFHVLRGGYTNDTDSYMHWMDAADNNNIDSIAMPLTVDPEEFMGVLKEPDPVWVRQTLMQYVVHAYSAFSSNLDKQRLKLVYFAVDPRLQMYQADAMEVWREAICR